MRIQEWTGFVYAGTAPVQRSGPTAVPYLSPGPLCPSPHPLGQ